MTSLPEPVSVIGGTGQFGRGLCRHLARAGVNTVIGSREAERARDAADSLSTGDYLRGDANEAALRVSRMVVLVLPYGARDSLLEPLAGALSDKTVVDTTVPLKPGSPDRYDAPDAGSAALELAGWLDDESVALVSGFHSLGAAQLEDGETPPASDVFYCGDPEGKRTVETLLGRLGWRGHDTGDLERSQTLERLAPMMIHLNRRYGREGLGLTLADRTAD